MFFLQRSRFMKDMGVLAYQKTVNFTPLKATFHSVIAQKDGKVWGLHLMVPDAVVQDFKDANAKRVLCSINNATPIHAGLMSAGDGRYFITLNKAWCKKHNLLPQEPVQVQLETDTSKYGMEMPEELAEFIRQEPEVDQYFHQLTPGKQRNLIHVVNSVKSPEIRLRKAWVISEHLKMQGGEIDYKALQMEMKEANRRDELG
jgi:hypothetical protein